jgi:iron complex outermembrane receptor protein
MKSIILIMSSLILGCHLYAQTIRGIVLSESGEPIPDALFKISDTYLKTYSDKNGCFEFKSLTPGIYIIMADCEGYEESFEKAIISDVDIELKFVLKKFDLSIHEVVISAVGAGNKTPVAYLNITKTEIDQSNNGQDIPYILGNTPSMVATSDAGTGIGYTSMRIRGTDMTRINITIDGIPLNDSESHEVWWVDMPDFSSSIENIQIQRGAGTSTNGSGAFGANINLQTNTLNKQAYSEINLLGGSYRTFKESFKGGSGLLNNSLIFDTRFSFVNSDGYIDRAKSKLNSYFISGTWFDNKNVLKINLIGGHEETYQAWSGVPKDSLRTNRTYNPNTYENEIDNYTQSHFQVFYIRKLTQNLNFDLTAHYTHGVGYYEQYKEDEKIKNYGLNNIVFGGDTVTKTDLIRRKWMDNDFIGTIYALKYEKEKINILAGGSWNIYTGNHFGKILWAEYAANMNTDHEWYRNNG